MAKAEFYIVVESFVGNLDGLEVEYHKGEVVKADDPAIRKMPAHFEELGADGSHVRTVEQATAAPGEKRDVPAGHALTTADFRPRRRGAA